MYMQNFNDGCNRFCEFDKLERFTNEILSLSKEEELDKIYKNDVTELINCD